MLTAERISLDPSERPTVKLYSFYTPSHDVLLKEFFLPTIHDEYELILEMADQECVSARFMDDGWLKTMLKKVDLILRGIKENWGEPFLHSDVDVLFLRPTRLAIMDIMNGIDMAIQRNNLNGGLCAGFMAIQGNDRTLRLWQWIRDQMVCQAENTDGIPINDQALLCQSLIVNARFPWLPQALKTSMSRRGWNPCQIRWDYLPDRFFGYGLVKRKIWKRGERFAVPKDIAVFHANYVVGVEDKKAILDYVQDMVKRQWHHDGRLHPVCSVIQR